jgi:nitroimidazol reductase NimA-like FMN-containing flavoprotein (pyridoxamine 5'-phosphate oxidase superfamily)
METVKTEFTSDVAAYLNTHHTLTLSTSSFTGMPHANTAPYVNDDHRVYFFARDGSILLRNLQESGHLAFTVDDYKDDWGKRRELHGEGHFEVATGGRKEHALELAAEKYGDSMPSGVLCTFTPGSMYFVEYNR